VDAHLDSIFAPECLITPPGPQRFLESPCRCRERLPLISYATSGLAVKNSSPGVAYYTTHLTQAERDVIAFDIDADVTATPNYDYEVPIEVRLQCQPIPA